MYYDGNSTYFATVVIAPLDEMISETESTGGTTNVSISVNSDATLSSSVLTDASASSELATDSYDAYYATNVLDGDTATAWVEGASGAGKGESITLRIDSVYPGSTYEDCCISEMHVY